MYEPVAKGCKVGGVGQVCLGQEKGWSGLVGLGQGECELVVDICTWCGTACTGTAAGCNKPRARTVPLDC